MGTVATVVLDGVDVTAYCLEGSVTRRLNRPATASVRINMQAFGLLYGTGPFPAAGSYLKVYFENSILGTTPVLWHHGRVLLVETTVDEEGGYTVVNSSDPLELWQARPVRDDDGDFSKPDIINEYQFGPEITQAMVVNSETAGAGPPSFAEGPTRLQIASVATGIKAIPAAPTDWPMTMAELATWIVSTGTLDIVVMPIEFTGPNNDYGSLSLWNGDYGDDLSTSVAFQYGMGLYNVRALRWSDDMTTMCNKLWYYLGPRVGTENDPAGDQHWQANIQGDDPAFNPDGVAAGAWALANNYVADDVVTNGGVSYICYLANLSAATNEPGVGATWQDFWFYWMVPPGGRLSPPASATNNQVGVQDYTSRLTYDVRMDIQIFDGNPIIARDLFRRQWQNEQWLRAQPRQLVHITPTRDTGIGEFDIGDLVLVEAAAEVKGGFSGAQRVYEYTISWDAEDSVCAIGELQVSSDNEGFST